MWKTHGESLGKASYKWWISPDRTVRLPQDKNVTITQPDLVIYSFGGHYPSSRSVPNQPQLSSQGPEKTALFLAAAAHATGPVGWSFGQYGFPKFKGRTKYRSSHHPAKTRRSFSIFSWEPFTDP